MRNGTFVRVGEYTSVPVRYRNRVGVVVGRKKIGTRFNYLVDFGARRAEPLPLPKRVFTVV